MKRLRKKLGGLFPLSNLEGHTGELFTVACLAALCTLFVVVPLLWRLSYLALYPPVPSGDDQAAHAYFSMTALKDPSKLITQTNQYPNVIHISLGIIYIISGSNLVILIGALKLLSFTVVAAGFILFAYVVLLTFPEARTLPLAERVALGSVVLSFLALFSRASSGL
jgi:hypothetical protein